MIITIFGSSQPNEDEYLDAYNIGKLIGKNGHTLKNGAYGGTMEASAKGCRESGGKVIGITVMGHKIDKAGKPNDYNSKVIEEKDVIDRVRELLNCDLVLILNGNIGTLSELFMAWVNALEKGSPNFMVIGSKMIKLLKYLEDNNFILEEYTNLVNKAASIEDIYEHIVKANNQLETI